MLTKEGKKDVSAERKFVSENVRLGFELGVKQRMPQRYRNKKELV